MHFSIFLNSILLIVMILLTLPIIVLLIQAIMSFFARNNQKPSFNYDRITRPKVCVLIPAHNEELNIRNTLVEIKKQLVIGDKLLVVADNCTDNTKKIVEANGVSVVERFDKLNKGKGYALDFGVKHLFSEQFSVLIVVDADCVVGNGFVDKVSKACVAMNRPIQAEYIMTFPEPKYLKNKVIEFAWIVKNKVRPIGYSALKLPCQLMGTGMAFLWRDIKSYNLASNHLVEDVQLGLALSRQGLHPYYLKDTHVASIFPLSSEGVNIQRTRWEHGHLAIIFETLKELPYAIVQGKIQFLMQLLDLVVPPVALLLISLLTLCVASIVMYLSFEYILVAIYSCVLLLLLGLSVLIAWYGYGQKVIQLKQLFVAPLILIKKIPLYIKFFINRQSEWVRSKRD